MLASWPDQYSNTAAVIVDGLVVLEMNWNRKKQGNREARGVGEEHIMLAWAAGRAGLLFMVYMCVLLLVFSSLFCDMVRIGLGSAHPLHIGIVVAWGYWIAISWVPRATVEQEEENGREDTTTWQQKTGWEFKLSVKKSLSPMLGRKLRIICV
jgi:hypothetical protein